MKKKVKKSCLVLMLLIILFAFPTLSRAQTGFTQKDRELLIQLNTRVNEMEKRFEQRFEQVDKRFDELRGDMNNRFGEMMTYIGILAAIFAAITVGIFSFALKDRVR
jgi:Mg2+ and Co2+ transporter CorA